MENIAPIILFCYKRSKHLQKAVEALQKNRLSENSELYVFSDGYKDENDKEAVLKVRSYIRTLQGFKNVNIIERETNWGLANSIIDGVTQIINKFGKVIVLEGDIVTSPFFLTFMNKCLNTFENDNRVFSISGYTPNLKQAETINQDIFLFPRISSWGWGSWSDRWNSVDWEVTDFNSFIRNKRAVKKFNIGGMDLTPMLLNQQKGKIDSWAIRFSYACFKQAKYCIYPKYSLVLNIGADGSGTHVKKSDKYDSSHYRKELYVTEDVNNHELINAEFQNFFRQSFYRKVMNLIQKKFYIYNHD